VPRALHLLLAGVLLAATACAHGSRVARAGAGPQPADSVVLNVVNHDVSPVVVFALGETQRYRLGTVDQGSRKQFVVRQPWIFGPAVEFVAEGQDVGGGRFRSGHLFLMPGDILDWDLQTSLVHTRATLRL
jgi:hypothetical protein